MILLFCVIFPVFRHLMSVAGGTFSWVWLHRAVNKGKEEYSSCWFLKYIYYLIQRYNWADSAARQAMDTVEYCAAGKGFLNFVTIAGWWKISCSFLFSFLEV